MKFECWQTFWSEKHGPFGRYHCSSGIIQAATFPVVLSRPTKSTLRPWERLCGNAAHKAAERVSIVLRRVGNATEILVASIRFFLPQPGTALEVLKTGGT